MLDVMAAGMTGLTAAAATAEDAVFAGNRAIGRIALAVTATESGSRRQRVHEAGALRVRFPNGDRRFALEAVIVNTAGGMASGDRFNIDLDVGPEAALTVTTASAEKIYRSLGPDTAIHACFHIGAGGSLAWLPQETILFDRARLRRSIDVDIASGGGVLLAEAVVFGRAAMGEAVRQGDVLDCWRVRMDGSLVFADTLRIGGDIADQLARPAIARAGAAMASILKLPGSEQDVAAVGAMQQDFAGEVGASAWNGFALARLVAADGAALRHDLLAVLRLFHTGPLPRLWLN
jgi:urease accessory protein